MTNRPTRTVTLCGGHQQLLAILLYEATLAAMLSGQDELIADLISVTAVILGTDDMPDDIKAMVVKAERIRAARS